MRVCVCVCSQARGGGGASLDTAAASSDVMNRLALLERIVTKQADRVDTIVAQVATVAAQTSSVSAWDSLSALPSLCALAP